MGTHTQFNPEFWDWITLQACPLSVSALIVLSPVDSLFVDSMSLPRSKDILYIKERCIGSLR